MLCSWLLAFPRRRNSDGPFTESGFSPGGGGGSRQTVFREALRDFGYVEGRNITFEYRGAQGKLDRLPELAAELVRLKPDVIVTSGDRPILAAREATRTIPIVMVLSSDPIGLGYIANLARPGDNVTGLTSMSRDLAGKRLELLKEVVPKISRVAILRDPRNPGTGLALKETEVAGEFLKMHLQSLEVRHPDEFVNAFRSAAKERTQALIIFAGGLINTHFSKVLDFAVKHRLPAMYTESESAIAGGLMAYSTSIPDLFRRAATYVDKILKGTKPADLPVEQPMKFELVINLKAAKQIGLTIPPNVLARADKVIR